MYICNGGQGAKNKINMNKINNGAKMDIDAKNTTTAHMRAHCALCKERETKR